MECIWIIVGMSELDLIKTKIKVDVQRVEGLDSVRSCWDTDDLLVDGVFVGWFSSSL